MTLTYSHNQIDGHELVLLWPHRHGWLEDGAHWHVIVERVIVVEGDVRFGQVPGPEGESRSGRGDGGDQRSPPHQLNKRTTSSLVGVRPLLLHYRHLAELRHLRGVCHIKDPELPVNRDPRRLEVLKGCRSVHQLCLLKKKKKKNSKGRAQDGSIYNMPPDCQQTWQPADYTSKPLHSGTIFLKNPL